MSMPTAKRSFHFPKEILATFIVALFFFFAACSNPDRMVERKVSEANANIESGQWENAIDILEGLLSRFPDRPDVSELLAFTLSQANRHIEAAEAFIRTRSLVPERYELALYAADSFERSGELEEASRQYSAYLALNPGHFASWQRLGRIKEEQDRFREGAEAYENAYALRAEGPLATRIGELYLDLGNRLQAREWFETARVHKDHGSGQALLRLVEMEMDTENFERAEELLTEIDTLYPTAVDEATLTLPRSELNAWREDQAELTRLVEEAAREAKEEAEARRAEARAREAEEALAIAEAEAEALALVDSDFEEEQSNEEPWLEIGTEEPWPEVAETSAAPTASELAQLGKAQREAGEFQDAVSLYWSSLTVNDEVPETWFELSLTLYDLKEFAQAEVTALEAIRRNPGSELYHMHYLRVARESLSVRAYLRELDAVRLRFPNNPDLLLALAQTYSASDHSRDLSVHYYREFLRVAPNHSKRPEVQAYLRELSAR